MIRINTLQELINSDLTEEFKTFLINKFTAILKEYELDDISDIFSIIILDDNEMNSIGDRLFEFYDVMAFDGKKVIHTVCVPSDNHSEDIYLPYTAENEKLIESRCS